MSPQSDRPDEERRSREGLRVLIEEMMMQLRSAATHDRWTPEERARAEDDLERIMLRVRAEALGAEEEEEDGDGYA